MFIWNERMFHCAEDRALTERLKKEAARWGVSQSCLMRLAVAAALERLTAEEVGTPQENEARLPAIIRKPIALKENA